METDDDDSSRHSSDAEIEIETETETESDNETDQVDLSEFTNGKPDVSADKKTVSFGMYDDDDDDNGVSLREFSNEDNPKIIIDNGKDVCVCPYSWTVCDSSSSHRGKESRSCDDIVETLRKSGKMHNVVVEHLVRNPAGRIVGMKMSVYPLGYHKAVCGILGYNDSPSNFEKCKINSIISAVDAGVSLRKQISFGKVMEDEAKYQIMWQGKTVGVVTQSGSFIATMLRDIMTDLLPKRELQMDIFAPQMEPRPRFQPRRNRLSPPSAEMINEQFYEIFKTYMHERTSDDPGKCKNAGQLREMVTREKGANLPKLMFVHISQSALPVMQSLVDEGKNCLWSNSSESDSDSESECVVVFPLYDFAATAAGAAVKRASTKTNEDLYFERYYKEDGCVFPFETGMKLKTA